MSKLKEVAQNFSKYLNQQYKKTVSLNKEGDVIADEVQKYLALRKPLQDALHLEGLPFGRITSVYGKPDSGKTTFMLEGVVACQKAGVLPIIILTEHKLEKSRLEKYMEGNDEELLILKADSIEEGFSLLEKILRDAEKDKLVIENEDGDDIEVPLKDLDLFVFWDSIGNTLSDTELEYDVEDWSKNMGKHAQALRRLSKRVNRLLKKVENKIGVCFINQTYQSMSPTGISVETPYGGDAIPYASVLVLRMIRTGNVKMVRKGTPTTIGVKTKIQMKKNHLTHESPENTVYTVASGMIESSEEALKEFKKKYMGKANGKKSSKTVRQGIRSARSSKAGKQSAQEKTQETSKKS